MDRRSSDMPDVDPRVVGGALHRVGLPRPRLTVRQYADVVAVHTGSDNGLCVLIDLQDIQFNFLEFKVTVAIGNLKLD